VKAVVLLVAVLLLVVGCGSDKSSNEDSTVAWANGLCSAVTTFRDSVQSTANTFSDNVTQAGFKDAEKQVKEATDTFVTETKKLGKPETDAGDQAKQTVETLADQLKADLEAVENASGSGLVQTLSVVSTTLTTAQTQVKTAFDQLESLDAQGELSDAFKQASACDSLRKSS
jgi:hypothetical protein